MVRMQHYQATNLIQMFLLLKILSGDFWQMKKECVNDNPTAARHVCKVKKERFKIFIGKKGFNEIYRF